MKIVRIKDKINLILIHLNVIGKNDVIIKKTLRTLTDIQNYY